MRVRRAERLFVGYVVMQEIAAGSVNPHPHSFDKRLLAIQT